MDVTHNRCQVAILAGGKGTRLKERTGNLPKPMALILGRPVLEHQIALCKKHGFTKIALLVHYEHDAISEHFGDGALWGVELVYVIEKEARGTAGALRDALGFMDSSFIVLYGDTYADVNLEKIWLRHQSNSYAATLLLHPNDHPHDSDLIEINEVGVVLAVHPYPHPEHVAYANLVNAALYVLNRDGLENFIPASGKADLAKHTFSAMIEARLLLQSYVTPEYIKDMGTPARLDKVAHDITAGLPERLSDRHLRSAIFLDRDGTLNEEVGHLNSPDKLRLLPGVAKAIHAINRAGLLAVGVTNQPVIARGDVSWSQLKNIHATLDHLLGQGKAYLDRMYVCPHHPDRGFEGELPELKFQCHCRKPETGLFDQAIHELNISRRRSWMIGDTTSDMLAGLRSGVRTILVRTGYAGLDAKYDVQPDFILPDLISAVNWILTGYAAMYRRLLPVAQSAASSLSRTVLIGGLARSGKTSAARVLADLLFDAGKTVHIISLDNWLVPIEKRLEGGGVLKRYDMQEFKQNLLPILQSDTRVLFQIPKYERKTKQRIGSQEISIGPYDIIIIEGVPALLDSDLLEFAEVRLYLEISQATRAERVKAEYRWRGVPSNDVAVRMAQRESDEVPIVKASKGKATFVISGEIDDSQ